MTVASAALVTDGLGYSPPKEWKCRSGVHTAVKPLRSAHFAPSRRRRYLPRALPSALPPK